MFGKRVFNLVSSPTSVKLLNSRSLSGEVKTVTLIPGDGIGPEIARSVQR